MSQDLVVTMLEEVPSQYWGSAANDPSLFSINT